MKKFTTLLAFCLTLACAAQPRTIEWSADFFPPIRSLFGEPQVFWTSAGAAVHFDGRGDGVFVDSVPVAGLDEFTLEVVFRQDGAAAFEQRFLHIGTMDKRILFETRVNPDKTWYFDAFVNLGTPEATPEQPNPVRQSAVLIDEKLTHPTDRWYSLARSPLPTVWSATWTAWSSAAIPFPGPRSLRKDSPPWAYGRTWSAGSRATCSGCA